MGTVLGHLAYVHHKTLSVRGTGKETEGLKEGRRSDRGRREEKGVID